MPIAEFSLVAFDCPDPRELAGFYQQIVGGTIDDRYEEHGWIRLRIEGKADIAFQRDQNYQPPGWPDGVPQQAHMDFDVPDLDAAETAALEIGATKAEVQPTPEYWRVMLDPVGHPFCFVKV